MLAGDLIIEVIGAGPVQTGFVVALAISVAVLFNPVRVVHRAAGPTRDLFAHQATTAA